MSQLTIYAEENPGSSLISTDDPTQIVKELEALGARFERWTSPAEVQADDDNETILQAYDTEIQKLVSERGYKSWDVISLNAEHPDKASLRAKFTDEHTHAEDEVRFFVRGSGLFVMHCGKKVYALLCTKGDLISVPARTKHWFDMGPNPEFTCIRVFNSPEGWVADYTGDKIAATFPPLEN
ncbi:MAG: cupin [Kofleriaceae bacterium]|nr:cupin [Kofleriaceae bacterium]